MTEPKYDEDVVNLGYLNKVMKDVSKDINLPENVSRHYGSKPQPPYYKGDTWIDGRVVYTCINSREIGVYTDSDWVTESGAKKEAETKNKTYLKQPSNYSVGDMWILQSDDDHKAGKKGEILITTVGRKEYNEDDWVNMLGYGDISSVNKVAEDLNDAINRIGNIEEAVEDGLLTTFYQDTIPETTHIGDLWYVTGEIENYTQGKIYRYDGTNWSILDDPAIQKAFDEANEARIVADGKIQSFYSETEPTKNMGVGDLWIDTSNNNQLYRYNGTNWVIAYDTRTEQVIRDLDTVTKRTSTIETDLGEVNIKVAETTTVTDKLTGEVNTINQEIGNIKSDHQKWVASFEKTGGNNIFYYDLDSWDVYSGIEEASGTEIQQNSVSGMGYIINSGSSYQTANVQNGTYTVSFKYKKLASELANASVKINDKEYPLTETDWTEFSEVIEAKSNYIKVEFISDTNDSLYVVDLLGNAGSEKEIWTQNPNEIRTDTVKIGRGIEVESSTKNTIHRIDADGNRTINKNTGKVVNEATDKGTETEELLVRGQAQISGLLIKQVRRPSMGFKFIIIA